MKEITSTKYRQNVKDTRKALLPSELSDEIKDLLKQGYKGKETPYLNHLMK